MILFLDFDGVLHPSDKPIKTENEFSRLPLIEEWLRAYKAVDVVISSSWREEKSLAQLKHALLHRLSGLMNIGAIKKYKLGLP